MSGFTVSEKGIDMAAGSLNRISSDMKEENIATLVVIESVCYCCSVAYCSNRFSPIMKI